MVQLARANRAEEALPLLLRAIDIRAKRKTFGTLELRAWESAVWDVARINAELRWAMFDVPLSPPLTLALCRNEQDVVDRLARLTPPTVQHWSNSPEQESEGGESNISATLLYNTARRLLVRSFASGTLGSRLGELTSCALRRMKATESSLSLTLSAPFTPALPTRSNHCASAASAKLRNAASPFLRPSTKPRED